MSRNGVWIVVGLAVAALVALGVSRGSHAPPRAAPPTAAPEHTPHGTPAGWKFSWPRGDAASGREVFAKFECWTCHEVKGESFPAPKDAATVGPELSHMGSLHEPDFFAESIINPNAIIDQGYAGPDGSSKMPSFNDSMTVQEAVDLVAYLAALRPPRAGAAPPALRPGERAPSTGGHKH